MKIAFIGFHHAHMYSLYNKCKAHPQVEIVAAWENIEEYQTEALEQGVEFTHADYRQILADRDVDAVAIGNYYGGRGQLAIEALKAGKYIIADKPLCTRLSEYWEIEKLVKEKNLKVGLMLDLRYMGVTEIAKEIISSGRLGDVHAVNFGGQHSLNYGKRAGWYFEEGKHGGTINDIAIHGIDLVSYLIEKDVKQIHSARCWNAFAKEVPHFEDSAQIMLEFENSVGLIADLSYAAPGGIGFPLPQYWRFTFWGTEGVIEFNYGSNRLWAAFKNASEPEIYDSPETVSSDYLSDFLEDINGTPTYFETGLNLRSTKILLEIQEFADKKI